MRWAPLLLLCTLPLAVAQTPAPEASGAPYDLGWARAFASPDTKDADHKWDPQFRALMQSSFHQRQTFWRDHGRFASVPDLVTDFLGVPVGIFLDGDRFVTMDGCVPHACSARGMVWMDTIGHEKPLVIFVATQDVSTSATEKGAPQHLWFFASKELNWQKMPQDFKTSLSHWYSSYQATWAKEDPIEAALITLVQPGGLTVDLSPSLFGLERP